MARLKTFVIFAVILSAGYLIGFSLTQDHGHEREGTQVAVAPPNGKKAMAPGFTLKTVDGKSISLSDYRGRWVFLNFWATWCGPCVIEMPMMNKLYNKFKDRGFVMLGVSIDEGNPVKVAEFAKDFELDFPILLDPLHIAANQYGVSSIPLTYMIGPDGKLEAIAEGARSWDSLEMVHYLSDLMDGKMDEPTKKEDGQKS